MSIELVSAFLMINGECGESMFSVEVKENKVEILNASGKFNSFNDTKKALEEAIQAVEFFGIFENEEL